MQSNFDHKLNIKNWEYVAFYLSFFKYVFDDFFFPFTAHLFFLLVLLFWTSKKGSNWSDIKIEREMHASVEEFGLLVDLLIKVRFRSFIAWLWKQADAHNSINNSNNNNNRKFYEQVFHKTGWSFCKQLLRSIVLPVSHTHTHAHSERENTHARTHTRTHTCTER